MLREYVGWLAALIVFSLILAIIAAALALECKRRRRPGWAAVMAVLAIAFVGGFLYVNGLTNTALAQREVYEAQLHEQFSRKVQPIVDELRRLEFEPPTGRDFYEEMSYNFDGDVVGEGSTGNVAVRNSKGRMIWVDFQVITNNDVQVGCVNGEFFVTSTPVGARQLRATLGCDHSPR